MADDELRALVASNAEAIARLERKTADIDR
jgi:hypothetical protein